MHYVPLYSNDIHGIVSRNYICTYESHYDSIVPCLYNNEIFYFFKDDRVRRYLTTDVDVTASFEDFIDSNYASHSETGLAVLANFTRSDFSVVSDFFDSFADTAEALFSWKAWCNCFEA